MSSPLTARVTCDLRWVRTGSRKRIVCSRSVARASKPFRAMLYGGFAESKPRNVDSDWTIPLPEDNPEAFATLMNIIHGHFKMVPRTVTRDQLYRITILTDKYNMTDVLQPWADKWVSPLVTTTPTASGDEALMWIAWELGHRELFLKTATFLLERSSIGTSANIICAYWPSLQDNIHVASIGILGEFSILSYICLQCLSLTSCASIHIHSMSAESPQVGPFPTPLTNSVNMKCYYQLSDQISAQRVQEIGSMFWLLQSAIDELLEPLSPPQESPFMITQDKPSISASGIPVCRGRGTKHAQECRTFYIGSVIQSLVPKGYYPVPSSADYAKSVFACRSELSTLLNGIQKLNSLASSRDSCCPGPTIATEINSFQSAFSLTAAQEKRLTEQSLRSGISGMARQVSDITPAQARASLLTGVTQEATSPVFTVTNQPAGGTLFPRTTQPTSGSFGMIRNTQPPASNTPSTGGLFGGMRGTQPPTSNTPSTGGLFGGMRNTQPPTLPFS